MSAFATTDYVRNSSGEIEPPPERLAADPPISIYEVHLRSWMRVPEEQNRPLTQAELGPKLAEYASRLHFTHVELVGAPETPMASAPPELARLIGRLHEHNLGVILDARASAGEQMTISEAVRKLRADGLREGNAVVLIRGQREMELTWNRLWTARMLDYLAQDPLFRKFRHRELSDDSRANHCILPLSHDEVTLGRRSLLSKMPGDEWQKFANLRLLLASLWARPGKKLLLMGGEFGQWNERNPDASLDWHLMREGNRHSGLQKMVRDLNHLYLSEGTLQADSNPTGFEWGNREESELSVIDWLRRGNEGELLLAAFNFTPVPRHNHRLGVPCGGIWHEVFNSDASNYGGSGQGNLGGVEASPLGWRQHSHSLTVTLPPLGAVFFAATDRS